MAFVYAAIISALLALLGAGLLAVRNLNAPDGSEAMRRLSLDIQEGAIAFLRRQYSCLLVCGALGFFLLVFTPELGILTAISFIVGALCSGAAGYLGMRIATKSNVRMAQAAATGTAVALRVGYISGAVSGLTVVGLGVLGIAVLFLLYTQGGSSALIPTALKQHILGFSLGAASIALFARVGGGIYATAARMGAALVGKVEAGIPEDDLRNPAVIAAAVGTNVGGVGGTAADLFESYAGAIISAMLLGYTAFRLVEAAVFPLIIAGVGILASLAGVFYTLRSTSRQTYAALRNGTFVAAALMIVGAIAVTFASSQIPRGVLYAIVVGLLAGTVISLLTGYYTSYQFRPARGLSADARTGAATNLLGGLSLGMLSASFAMATIAVAVFIAFGVAGGFSDVSRGLFGLAMAAVGMLSTLGVTLAVDAYGPVASNADGIAQMSGLSPEVREVTGRLDSIGNTTAAVGAGFAIGSTALTVLAFFAAFTAKANLPVLDLTQPVVIGGLFIGSMLPFLHCSLVIRAAVLASRDVTEEVRRQFREIPGLLEGKARGNHARCVDLAARGALRRMLMPGLLAVLSPIAVGLALRYLKAWLYAGTRTPGGAEAVAGLLAGALVSGVMLALLMANAGGAWESCKKLIERGNFGGRGGEPHQAAIVVGGSIGDFFKDAAAPGVNSMLKLMSIVALVFVVWFA